VGKSKYLNKAAKQQPNIPEPSYSPDENLMFGGFRNAYIFLAAVAGR